MPRPRHTHFPTLKRLVGTVVSTGMDRTAVVAITRLYIHPLTRKIMKHVSKYFCHDAHEICGVGDRVQIKLWGLISKKKRYTVIDILQRHPQLSGEPFPMSRLRNPPTVEEVEASRQATLARITAQQQELLNNLNGTTPTNNNKDNNSSSKNTETKIELR